MKMDELLSRNLIRRETPNAEEIDGTMVTARHFLDRAKGNMGVDFYDTAFLLAYTAMFHEAKALLLKAGYKERSHYSLIAALKELYANDASLEAHLNTLDSYRTTGHAIQYSGDLSSERDASQAIRDCESFINAAGAELGKRY